MLKRFLLVSFTLLFWVSFSQAEQLGTLELDEFNLRAAGLVREGQHAEFSLAESLLGFSWNLDQYLGAKIALGSMSLLNVPLHFTSTPGEELGIVEAYGQYNSPYGSFWFGLIPLQYSMEGSAREGDLQLPRSLLFKNRVLGLRDYGMRFETQHKGYFTRIAAHNGEADKNLDGRVWVTASWGWTDYDKVVVGFSGRTGTTKPVSTAASGDTLAGVDPSLEAKWRMGTAYIHWAPHRWNVALEGTWGEVEQDKKRGNKFVAGHFDLGYDLTPNFGFLGRVDYFDPNDKVKRDGQKEISLAWVWRSHEGNSRLYFVATRVEEEGQKINNDEFKLIWQMSPKTLNKITP